MDKPRNPVFRLGGVRRRVDQLLRVAALQLEEGSSDSDSNESGSSIGTEPGESAMEIVHSAPSDGEISDASGGPSDPEDGSSSDPSSSDEDNEIVHSTPSDDDISDASGSPSDPEDGSSSDPSSSDDYGFNSDEEGGNVDLGEVGHDDNDDGEPELLNDHDGYDYLMGSLKQWALRGVSKAKIDQLLGILRPLHNFLPKSYKTLLRTPRRNVVDELGTGIFWYKGVQKNIEQKLTDDYFQKHDAIIMDVNMDGMKVFVSSQITVWPILGRFKGIEHPFIIAVYLGTGKPDDVNLYLQDYVDEIRDLEENGHVDRHGNVIPFVVQDYILDAEARSFIKQCIGHSGYFSCEKCLVRGHWYLRRICYPGRDFEQRTDDSFRNRDNPHHHTGNSPLEELGTGMTSQFRLDAMHLIYLGTVKRMMDFLISFPRTICRMSENNVNNMNRKIVEISSHFPVEMKRKPRPFGTAVKREKIKAKEYRRFILYDCLLVMKGGVVSDEVYECFVMLHCAIYILCSPELCQELNDVADFILQEFVDRCGEAFGDEFVVYNVHSTRHAAEECLGRGTLDSLSAFNFENFLAILKWLIRSANKPLQQLMNRDAETDGLFVKPKPVPDPNIVTLKQPIHGLQGLRYNGQQYATVSHGYLTLKLTRADRFFETINNEVVRLCTIIDAPGDTILVGQKFRTCVDYYDFPINSSLLGIFKVSDLGRGLHYFRLEDVKVKCVLLPDEDDTFLCVPLISYPH